MTLSRYPKYKDSGAAWLGQVPAHWEVRRLGFYFDERREKVSDKDYPALSVTKSGVVPQLDSAAKTDDGDNRKKVCIGDFVINSRSDRKGSAGAAYLEGSVSLINTVLQPRSDIKIEFAHHLLRSAPFQEEFYRFGKGIVADLWSTHYSEMRNILVALPRLPEQIAIATFLDHETGKIDALVAEQERLLMLLAEKRQATIFKAVTCGLSPDVPMRDSGVAWLGRVPEHWEVTPLKYLVTFVSGGTPRKENPAFWNGDIPWASAKDLKLDQLTDTGDHITQLALDAGQASLVPPGTILVVVRGMILARTFPVAEAMVPMAINQDLKGIQPIEGLNFRFLAFVLRGSMKESLLRLDEAGHGTKALRMDAWATMSLPVPPIKEQLAIVSFLDLSLKKLDELRLACEQAIALLKERRSALISAAVTGQIDVRGAVPQRTEQEEAIAA
jgi:type I restriction enzyme S subunit